ncbi:MAG TPA: amino acid adenylation domain-containing protein, partial [Thermoanaerobaculia bacterium]|nr:amino acid adenylation domain-containing protein [Thermoanaerobaculia bacterium]
LLRLGAEDHRLLLSMHHIVSDGWSIGVLLYELSALYGAFSSGRPSPLPELAVQYSDFTVWQRGWLSGETLAAELAWWRERLAGAPAALDLPADRPRPAVQTGRGASERFAFGEALAEGIRAVSRRHGATVFMTLLAAFDALLARWTGQEDLVVGTPIANRNRAEIEGLIGFFVNTLALRSDLSGDPPFAALLARVREATLSSYEHQDLPFEKLVGELAPERDLSRTPLFQVSFMLQNAPMPPLALGPGLTLSGEGVESGTAKFDLTLALQEDEGGLLGTASYSTDLFDRETIERLTGHLRTLLQGIVESPGARLSDLPLLTGAERSQLAQWHEETRREPGESGLLHGLFEAQAARAPGAVALIAGTERLTYADLDRRSTDLAARLAALGIGPETSVGLCLARTEDLVIAMLATLKAGGFYVPLDPAYPAERLAFMLEDSGCRVILAHARNLDRLPPHDAEVIVLDAPAEVVGAQFIAPSSTAPSPAPLAGNLAYLIYTSGSTGRPKAVAIEHRSAVLLAHWARGVFTPEELAGVLASTSITFDLSVFEIFVPLAWGGTVILADNALALPRIPAASEVTLINTVPSAIAELLRMEALPPSLATVNLAGEALTRALSDRVYERPGTARLYNLYGPSEDTTYSTFALIERSPESPPTIGRPLDGTQGHILDRHLQPLPVGVPGELCLGGASLARGYLGRPELTAERFVPDPWSGVPGARLYRTGDLVRRRTDGALDFLGRIDHQVKVRGFRIELGEIESGLLARPGVEAAAVLVREDEPGDRRIVAYVVLREGEEETADSLRRALADRVPEYMVPSAFVFLSALPLTPNGKLDRKRLPAPESSRPDLDQEFIAPRTALEIEVANIWADVLGVDQVGLHDSFWSLGGHSLLATKVLSRLGDALGVDMPLQTLFEAPTVERLTTAIGERVLAEEISDLSEEEILTLLEGEAGER